MLFGGGKFCNSYYAIKFCVGRSRRDHEYHINPLSEIALRQKNHIADRTSKINPFPVIFKSAAPRLLFKPQPPRVTRKAVIKSQWFKWNFFMKRLIYIMYSVWNIFVFFCCFDNIIYGLLTFINFLLYKKYVDKKEKLCKYC